MYKNNINYNIRMNTKNKNYYNSRRIFHNVSMLQLLYYRLCSV